MLTQLSEQYFHVLAEQSTCGCRNVRYHEVLNRDDNRRILLQITLFLPNLCSSLLTEIHSSNCKSLISDGLTQVLHSDSIKSFLNLPRLIKVSGCLVSSEPGKVFQNSVPCWCKYCLAALERLSKGKWDRLELLSLWTPAKCILNYKLRLVWSCSWCEFKENVKHNDTDLF